MEFELEAGAAGAVVVESDGALGEVDCCFEQATIARALRHNKRRLRFIDHLTVYLQLPNGAEHRGPIWAPGGSQRLDASSVPSQHWRVRASSRLRPRRVPDMLPSFAMPWGK